LRKVLYHLLEHAIAIGMIARNPAKGVKSFTLGGDGFHTWSEDEVAQFEARHPLGTVAYLALHLLLDTGQRRSDVMRMGWQHVQKTPNGDKIAVRQVKTKKTNEPLLIPIRPALALALANVPRDNLTFLLTSDGASYTPNNFGKQFHKWCSEAGLPQCSAHGLRKLAATRLTNAGCTEHEIMSVTGHVTPSELGRYVRARDQASLAERAMAKLSCPDENKTAQNLVQPSYPVGQNGR
jgi:integrase